MNFDKVIIFGGTHGNEWTGIYAVRKFATVLSKEFPSLNLEFIHANPEAFSINRRYKDEDLNRAFQFLDENRKQSYEHQRAKELKELITHNCLVIDLHTTTSNMGNTLILTQDQPINFYLASKIVEKDKNTKVLFSPDPEKKYLASQSPFGLMIEIGPVPNSVLDGRTLQATLDLLRGILHEISTFTHLSTGSIEIFEEVEDVFYPEHKGELCAYIHQDFQGKDFQHILGEFIPFRTFEGGEVTNKTTEKLYPIFINEAAYYPEKLAFTLCKKNTKSF
jgi:succinylglutamate desuccinylase